MSFKRKLKRNMVNKPLSRRKLELAVKDTEYELVKFGKLKGANYKGAKLAVSLTKWRKVALVIFSHAHTNKNMLAISKISEIL